MDVSRSQLKRFFHQRAHVRFVSLLLLFVLLFLAGSQQAFAEGIGLDRGRGAVYVMSNDAAGNEILVFDRADDGTLSAAGAYPTGGLGTGGGLGSQGALVLSENGRWLFAVNAGSDEISIFAARGNHLTLLDTAPSGGEQPISLAVYRRRLFVLNAGGSGNVTGFHVGANGALMPIPNSTAYLSNGGVGAAPGPAQVSFTPNGRQLVVTEKGSNLILTYDLRFRDGIAGPYVNPSEGMTPFGFDFTPQGQLIVSEAFGGAPDASAASSYALDGNALQVISSSVPTNQTAACWVVVTDDGRYAYTTNTGSSSVSGYEVDRDGTIALLDASGVTGETGPGSSPIDAIIDRGGFYLFVLSGGTNTVTSFEIHADGSLSNLGDVSVPAGSVGIAAS